MFNILFIINYCIFLIFNIVLNEAFDLAEHPNWHLLNDEDCGVSMTDRIIGGKKAGLGKYPWIARIGYTVKGRKQGKFYYRCAGTLINKIYVLTAAHCVSAERIWLLSTIRLGEYNSATEIDCEDDVCAEAVQDFKISNVTVHEDYNKPTFRNDIALIRLDRPANFNGWVEPICFLSQKQLTENYAGTTAEVAGWGITNTKTQEGSDELQYINLPVVDIQKCIDGYKEKAEIGIEQLCAGGVIGEDSCGGDSGGPLMKPESISGPPRYYFVGIVSFGPEFCGSTDLPAIYTRIASYAVWVLDKLAP